MRTFILFILTFAWLQLLSAQTDTSSVETEATTAGFADKPTGTDEGGSTNPSTEPPFSHEEEKLFHDKVLLLSIKKEKDGKYRFTITDEDLPKKADKKKAPDGQETDDQGAKEPDSSANFTVKEIGLQKERLEIFMHKFYQAYFEDLYPCTLSVDAIKTDLAPNAPKLEISEKNNIKKELDELETDLEFKEKEFREKIKLLIEKLGPEGQEEIKTLTEQLIDRNQTAHQQLKRDLRELATGFLREAIRKENLPVQEGSNAIFGYIKPIEDSQIEAYETHAEHLHRKSVEIGRQLYTLVVKGVTAPGADTSYVFKLSLGDESQGESQFFEVDDIKANAHTIGVMVQKMRNALDQLIRYRTNQLPPASLQRITAIANQLSIDRHSINSQDREFLRSSIRDAANHYGFDAQKLRQELRSTGLLDAIGEPPANALAAARNAPAVPVEDWILEATVTHTEFIDHLNAELRNIASDFLFAAYVKTISVLTDELKIGTITAAQEINLYRKDLTYGHRKIAKPANKEKSEYFPVSKVKIETVKIEFENEQINNIEVTAIKQGEPDNLLASQAIEKEHKFIYLKLEDIDHQPIEIPIELGKFQEKFDGFTTIAKAGANTSFSFEVENLGELTLNLYKFETDFGDRSADAEDEKKDKDNKVSFHFHLVLSAAVPNVSGPRSKEGLIRSAQKEQEYINQYTVNGKPRGFDVGVYLDQKGIKVLKVFKGVTPHLVIAPLQNELKYDKEMTSLSFEMDSDMWLFEVDRRGDNTIYNKVLLKYRPRTTVGDKRIIKDSGEQVFNRIITIPIGKKEFFASTDISIAKDIIEKDTKIIFQNQFPFSYSTKGDVTYYVSGKKKKLSRPLFSKDNLHFIELNEAITNEVTYYNNTENYSPRNSVVVIKSPNTPTPIYKEATTQILKAKIFSDFQGFDETNPNGLVQTEVSKRFFLNTTSTSFLGNFMYDGYMNYIEPKLVLSKLENQNKYLPLRSGMAISAGNGDGPDTAMVDYVSSMDILNYSNLSIGSAIGLAYYGVPSLHLRLQIGVGGYIHQSGFSTTSNELDTVSNQFVLTTDEFNANSIVYYPELRMAFNPDPRFGLQLAWRPTSVLLLSNTVKQIDNEPEFLKSQMIANNRKWVHQIQLFAFIQVSKENSGEFFMRTNFNIAGDDRNNNFLQLQLGYAFNIFARDKASDGKTRVVGTEGATQ